MPAAQKSAVETVRSLAVVAGGGVLPLQLIEACEARGIDVFIVGLKSYVDETILAGRAHVLIDLRKAAKAFDIVKRRGIKDLVLIGAVRRPPLLRLFPDWRTFRFIMKALRRPRGDHGLLSSLRELLEEEGFTLHGAQAFLNGILMPDGLLTKTAPDETALSDLALGLQLSQDIGRQDIGQAVIVAKNVCVGIEDVAGTDMLIKKCGRHARGGVLVKTCKPQQDMTLDLPTIGPRTIENAVEAGLAGIAVQASASLIVEKDECIRLANDAGIFIIGVSL